MPEIIKLKPFKYKGGTFRFKKVKGTDWHNYEWTWQRGRHYNSGKVEDYPLHFAKRVAKERVDKSYY